MIGVGELKDMALYRAVVAEFIGTMMLCFSILILYQTGAPLTLVALVAGSVFAALNWSFRAHNAGHFNPVISLSGLAFRKITLIRWVFYFCAQFLGAIVGAAFIRAMYDDRVMTDKRNGAVLITGNVKDSQAFLIEFLGSFLIVLVFQEAHWNPLSRAGDLAPLAAGFAYTVAGAFTSTYTLAGLNPVRAFASASTAKGGAWGAQWVAWVGPGCGAIFAIAIGFIMGTHKGNHAVAPHHDVAAGERKKNSPA
eukprot:c17612_g1_i2.p2 GENE.c17612_g1_i2~~c17612_g1_i2.p2  ORF type:complete len:266 (+),score=54.47 c17612_g1_i2:45-800(+)